MSVTLLEASKLTQDPMKKGVIETFARTSSVLQYLPFMNVSSNSYTYNSEDTLPGIGFRGINESWTESSGVVNPRTEQLAIMGGVVDVDRVLQKTQGNIADIRATQTMMKSKAAALKFTSAFIKGDSQSNPKSFDGLQVRVAGEQLIAAGSTDGGDALSLSKLDEAIDAVQGKPTVIFTNKTMIRLITQAARTQSIHNVNWLPNQFGEQITHYNGIPLIALEQDHEDTEILGFTELGSTGSTATATSLYCVKFGPDAVSGLQCGGTEPIPAKSCSIDL